MPKESTRAYIYRVTLAVLPLLTAYGLVSENKVPFLIALAASILNVGLASANTSTKS
jgi:hypothetical protein